MEGSKISSSSNTTSTLALNTYLVIKDLKGNFNSKVMDYKVGDVIELTPIEAFCYRAFIKEQI